jgi:hypothetical protein
MFIPDIPSFTRKFAFQPCYSKTDLPGIPLADRGPQLPQACSLARKTPHPSQAFALHDVPLTSFTYTRFEHSVFAVFYSEGIHAHSSLTPEMVAL